MTSEAVQRALTRSRTLLRPERARRLDETNPELPPESLGALAGIAFEDPDGGVRVSVYVIPGADNQGLAVDRLREKYPDRPGIASKVTNNGPILLFAHTTASPDRGSTARGRIPPEDRLAKIVTAFAGDE